MDQQPPSGDISFIARILFLSLLLPFSLAGEEEDIAPIPVVEFIDTSLYNVEALDGMETSRGVIFQTNYQNEMEFNDERLGQAYAMLDSGVLALFSQGSPQAFIEEFGLPWRIISYGDSQGRIFQEMHTYYGLVDNDLFSFTVYFFYPLEERWHMEIEIMDNHALKGLLFDNSFHFNDSLLDLEEFYPGIRIAAQDEAQPQGWEDRVYYEEFRAGDQLGRLALLDRGFFLRFSQKLIRRVAISNYYVENPTQLGEIQWEE